MTVTLRVKVPEAPYDVVVGRGLLDQLATLVPEHCPASRYAVVSDSSVAERYGARVAESLQSAAPTTLFTFPAGEWNKTRETWQTITDQLLQAGLDRHAAVIALGGGVVGDLTGFVAATYKRGIPVVQVPTSLLAMIDSSIGGKTGVDTPMGKNLVGAFHQPRLVVADVDTLSTLPPVQLAAGAAEAIKHGVIADEQYLELLTHEAGALRGGDPTLLVDVVRRSIEIKAAVVSQDERERGRRAILNFGHTVAHGLEATFGYEVLHGEAVAIGMVTEAALGKRLGITEPALLERLAEAIEAFELPQLPPAAVDPTDMLERMRSDKKARERTVRFALPRAVGEMAQGPDGDWTVPVPEDDIIVMLRSLA